MVPAGNKAKRFWSVSHTTKTIHLYHHDKETIHWFMGYINIKIRFWISIIWDIYCSNKFNFPVKVFTKNMYTKTIAGLNRIIVVMFWLKKNCFRVLWQFNLFIYHSIWEPDHVVWVFSFFCFIFFFYWYVFFNNSKNFYAE